MDQRNPIGHQGSNTSLYSADKKRAAPKATSIDKSVDKLNGIELEKQRLQKELEMRSSRQRPMSRSVAMAYKMLINGNINQ